MSKLFFVSLHQVTLFEDEMYQNKQKDSANVWLDVYELKKGNQKFNIATHFKYHYLISIHRLQIYIVKKI